MGTISGKDPQQTTHCLYSISCEYGRSCDGKTGRPMAVLPHQHKHNLRVDLLEKYKLEQNVYEEGNLVG
jgi:hypothetical protein